MMLKRAISRFGLLPGIACLWLPVAAHAGDALTMPVRNRTAAMLTGLFHFEETLGEKAGRDFAAMGIGSAAPADAAASAERGKIAEFARSLVYEGGYFPKEIQPLLGIHPNAASRVARVTRQLDLAKSREQRQPNSWEVAGRVGRSGAAPSSDYWAMAPGEPDEGVFPTPGTLAYLPPLAVAYAAYPEEGEEAAAQLAMLKDDDLRAETAARAAVSLLMTALTAERLDKDAWLRTAASSSRDPDTERDVRAVRVKDWNYLRGEECAMGRLERSVSLWYKGDSYGEIMKAGRQTLRSREALAYLSALTAATYGMEGLPTSVAARGASDRTLGELITDLQDLGTSEAVLEVSPSK